MKISAGVFALAAKIAEAATVLSHSDIRTRLSDALSDQYRGTGTWAYLVDVFGDDQSGDVIYSCDGDLLKAAYTCTTQGATIDTAAAVDVVPVTTYEVESSEPVATTEAGRRNSARDLKQLQTIHDHSTALGANCPGMKESAAAVPAQLSLTESATTMETIRIVEAKADYEIKLIAPGKGSSAFYPAEVLKRDGPKVFKAGTHVYLNHQTAAEEAARPEGDVANLAGVLTTDAVYHEAHAKGPGLYGRMKVFADHAAQVEEKAPHVGMSIRACGIAESGQKKDGVPVLKEFVAAQSVDIVTRAGAGGQILTEAARTAPTNSQQEADTVTAEEAKKLIEAGVAAATKPLLEREMRRDAADRANELLAGISLPAIAKKRIVEAATRELPLTESGALDVAKFNEAVVNASKAESEYLAAATGTAPRVTGMGAAAPAAATIDPKEAARRVESEKAEEASAIAMFESLGMPTDAATFAARGRAAA